MGDCELKKERVDRIRTWVGAFVVMALIGLSYTVSADSFMVTAVTAWVVFSLTWKGPKKKGE